MRLSKILAFLFWSVIFGVSYTQAPLYYSNQNQYFLHGLAAAGVGDLQHDWLANTEDPTPLFSGMVAVTVGYLHEGLFYLYYLLIVGVYFHSLFGLFCYLMPKPPSAPAKWLFIALLVTIHAGIVRWLSAYAFGVDYPWFFQAGLAGQYLLGFGLQPSVSGVFLLASILAFLRDRPWLAVIWACLAAIIHATYFPAAALLTLAYMLVSYRTRCLRRAVLLGGFALLLVSPALIYNMLAFAPSSASTFEQSQSILAHERIPHHCEIRRWLDLIAILQILWIRTALALTRRGSLSIILLTIFRASLALSLLQWLTGNDSLALLFPWRTSAILVPIATTIVLTKIVESLAPWLKLRGKVFLGSCGLTIGICFVGGLAVPVYDLGYRSDRDELPLLEWVKIHHRPGEVYLIPVETLKPWTEQSKRGVFNSNFVPPPKRGKADGFIALDLQQFRTFAGAALFVDFKAIPYKDAEVLEWWRRVEWCANIYAGKSANSEELHVALNKEGITHVVAPAKNLLPFASLGPPVYQDDVYAIFRVAN